MMRERMARLLAVGMLAAGIVLTSPTSASACTPTRPLSVAQALGTESPPDIGEADLPAAGVYEAGPIASVPDLGIVAGESVSAVTRYWGTPPAQLDDLERVGGRWRVVDLVTGGFDDCASDPHDISYGAVIEVRSGGSASSGTYSQRLAVDRDDPEGGSRTRLATAQEALLTERYGPPVEVGFGFSERLGAYTTLWWSRVALIAFLGLAVALPVRWLKRRRLAAATS